MDALKKAVAAKPKAGQDGEAGAQEEESTSIPIKLDTGMAGASPSPDLLSARTRLGEGGLGASPLGLTADPETLKPVFAELFKPEMEAYLRHEDFEDAVFSLLERVKEQLKEELRAEILADIPAGALAGAH